MTTSTVETVYRSRIDYDIDSDDCNRAENFIKKVSDFAFKIGGDFFVESFSGSPIYGPGLLLEGDNREKVINLTKRIEGYILRWRGARVL